MSTNKKVFKAITGVVVDCASRFADVIYPANPKELQKAAAEESLSRIENESEKKRTTKRSFGSITLTQVKESACGFISHLKNGSVAKRAVNAFVESVLPHVGIITESGARKKARTDIEILENTGFLEKTQHSRKKVPDEVIEFAVSFILSNYVQRLSWGTKKIRICSNETIELPKII